MLKTQDLTFVSTERKTGQWGPYFIVKDDSGNSYTTKYPVEVNMLLRVTFEEETKGQYTNRKIKKIESANGVQKQEVKAGAETKLSIDEKLDYIIQLLLGDNG